MKALTKLPLLAAIILTSACSTQPKTGMPFDLYTDKDKTFREMEKFFPPGFTVWEMSFTGKNLVGSAYERIYTYNNENFINSAFAFIEGGEALAYYMIYKHTKTSAEGWTSSYNDKGVEKLIDLTGYNIYTMTPDTEFSESTNKPRRFEELTLLIKVEGSKIFRYLAVPDAAAKTLRMYGYSTPIPTPDVFTKR